MKISLKQALENRKSAEFAFGSFTHTYDKDGKKIVVMALTEAIAHVIGSQKISDGTVTENLDAYDVTEVRVHENDMNDDIQVNEDGSGDVSSTTLRLDVTKSGEVWLRTKTFAQAGNELRAERTGNQQKSILEKLKERKKAVVKELGSKPSSRLQPVDTGNIE